MAASDKAKNAAKRIPKKVKVEVNLPGLPPGKRSSKMVIELDGIARDAFLIADATQGFERNLFFVHLRKMGDVIRISEEIFRNSIVRPAERNNRPGDPSQVSKRRMTGRFTFGTGKTFQGLNSKPAGGNVGEYSFGFPKIAVADDRTGYIWRALEFGLGIRADADPEGPRGVHLFPWLFRWSGGGGKGWRRNKMGSLEGGAGRGLGQDALVRAGGGARPKLRSGKTPAGIEPKRFIRGAMDAVRPTLKGEYTRIAAQTYGKL